MEGASYFETKNPAVKQPGFYQFVLIVVNRCLSSLFLQRQHHSQIL